MRYSIAALMLLVGAPHLPAQSFLHFGPRAMGMGGAFVAVADDVTSVYWNPAGVAIGPQRETGVIFGVQGQDEKQSIDNVKALVDMSKALNGRIITPEDITKAIGHLEVLASKGSGTYASADLDFVFGYQGIAVSVLGLGNASAVPVINLDILNFDPNSGEPLPTDLPRLDLTGVLAKQYAVTYSATLIQDALWAGASIKYIRGESYYSSRPIVDERNNALSIRDLVEEATNQNKRDSSAWGFDAGVTAVIVSGLRVGIVGRDMNTPKFDTAGPWKAQLNPQYRMGVSYQIIPQLLVAADYDLSRNDTRIPGIGHRDISIGGEGRLFNGIMAVRGGASKNVSFDGSRWRFSLGLGLNSARVSVDVAGMTDSEVSQAGFSLAGTFRY